MPHSRWRPQEFPLAEAQRLRGEGKNLYEIAEKIGWSHTHTKRKLRETGTLETFRHKRRAADVPISRDTDLATPTSPGEPSEPPGEPDERPQPPAMVHPSEPNSEPSTALQRVELMGEPGEPGLPDIARQSDLDALKARVDMLEAFITILQQERKPPSGLPNGAPPSAPTVHPAHQGLPSGTPTHKRGFVMADNLFEAIHAFADARYLQVKDALDLLVRTGLAAHGKAVDADA
jgi:hypothetical protein